MFTLRIVDIGRCPTRPRSGPSVAPAWARGGSGRGWGSNPDVAALIDPPAAARSSGQLFAMRSADVLLIRRFDRELAEAGWTRRAMVSALTLLGLDERMAAHASYEELADIVRARFTAPAETLKELFARMTFNNLVGNTDDHTRNHAAFWDGGYFTLTPAYNICPQSRTGREASQAMRIHRRERRRQLSLCLAAASRFRLRDHEAIEIVRRQIATTGRNWDKACDEARLTTADRRLLRRRQFLNDLAFEGLEDRLGGCLRGLPEG